MKSPKTAPPSSAQAARWLAWSLYGASGAVFLAGVLLLQKGNLKLGAWLSVAAVLVSTLAYLLPVMPWRALGAGLKDAVLGAAALFRRRPALPAPASAPRGAARARAKALPAAVAKGPSLGERLDALCARLWPDDVFSLSRYWLLAPTLPLLVMSQVALSQGSTPRAVGDFVASILLAAVYLQDMGRPLMLPSMRANLRAVLAQLPILPLQVVGAYLLHFKFENPRMVWIGFGLCAAGSALMVRALRAAPLRLALDEAPPSQYWQPSRPFYNMGRLSLISGLLAGSLISTYLARYVLAAEHPGWSVGFGFAAIALLLGSFPWIPSGLAWLQRLPDAAAALLGLASALGAFALGAAGQNAIERGAVDHGLWLFLAGGVLLVAGLSRFKPGDPSRPGEAGRRLEIAAVLLLIAVGFAFRIWNIGNFPYGVEGDEGGGGVWAMDTLMGRVEHPLIHQNYPLAFFSVTALFFKVAGVSLATLRWHSVLFGTLSIATTYLFLRLLFGRWSAFLATVLMAFSFWHLHYSRFGHYNIEQVALQMAAFYFVFKAFRTERWLHWVVGGLAFGLAMFPHMASRLLPFQGIALVLYLFAARRDLLRRHLPGFLMFMLTAWAVASPAVVYWNRARSISMGRIQSVSIFDKNNTNAPVDTLSGFVRNCKVSMMMFNEMGDSRSRDNPVAPEKILEHWSAILFGLAFLYVLYHWRDPLHFFLLSVFFINLAASIFSVEAPQTLRTAGNIPIVFAFMAATFAPLRGALLKLGRVPGTAIFALLLPVVGFFSLRSAEKLFVQARNLSFDTNPTYIAQVAGKEGGPDTQAVFWGTGFASSHPPMVLLAQQTPIRNFYGPFEYLPMAREDRDQLLFLSDQYQEMLPYVRWVYPGAKVEPIPDLVSGGTLAQYIRVNKDMLHEGQGMDGTMVMGGRTQPVHGLPPFFPAPGYEGAQRLELSSAVMIDSYARCRFRIGGHGDAELAVDGRTLFSRRGGAERVTEALLAKGLHAFRLDLRPSGPQDRMSVSVESIQPGSVAAPWAQRGKAGYELTRDHTLRMPVRGFRTRLYVTRMPEGDPVTEVIEPVVLDNWLDSPLTGNWSETWETRFKVDHEGSYGFSLRGGASFAQIEVDGQLVFRQGSPPDPEARPRAAQPRIQLKPGWHRYKALFCTSGPAACQLRWSPAGGPDQLFWTPDLLPGDPD